MDDSDDDEPFSTMYLRLEREVDKIVQYTVNILTGNSTYIGEHNKAVKFCIRRA